MKLITHAKYDFNDREIIHKYSDENFNTQSIVEVLDSQEALFMKNGQILDILPPGRHALITENIPILKAFASIASDSKSTFTSRLYYVNLKHNFDFLWGTHTPMNLLDPLYNVILPVGSSGHAALKITDSKKFFIKFAGTKSSLYIDEIISSFKSITSTNIKDILAETIVYQKISLININTLLLELSEVVKIKLNQIFNDYGLNIVLFSIENISVNENDPSFIQLKSAISKRSEMSILGYNYDSERKFDVLEGAANNSSTGGQLIGAGLGLGMGAAVGGQFGGIFESQMSKSNHNTKVCSNCNKNVDLMSNFCNFCGNSFQKINCGKCGSIIEKGNFCSNCGTKI